MIRAVIVDDEAPARRLLRKLLSEPTAHDFEVMAECSSGAEAVDVILTCAPDVVFLDVQMPRMDGFAVLERLNNASLPYIIFVTAFDEYAVRAFDAHALDYLLKPFSNARFAECLARIRDMIDKDTREAEVAKLLSLAQSNEEHSAPTGVDEKRGEFLSSMQVRDGSRVELLEFSKTLWLGAANQYVNAHTDGRSYLLSESLSALQQKLDPEKFFRIHRSAIVNVDYIKEVRSAENGAFAIILTDGRRLLLSRRRRDLLGELLLRSSGNRARDS